MAKEGKREREIAVCKRYLDWLPLAHPQLGTWPTTRQVPRLGIKPATLQFAGGHSIHWATWARVDLNLLTGISWGWLVSHFSTSPQAHAGPLFSVGAWPLWTLEFVIHDLRLYTDRTWCLTSEDEEWGGVWDDWGSVWWADLPRGSSHGGKGFVKH